MRVYDIFSKRKKRAEQTEPDVYQYDDLPGALRHQIQYILQDAIGPYYEPVGILGGDPPAHNNDAWRSIWRTLCREKGVQCLVGPGNPQADCFAYLHREQNIEYVLDLVEICLVLINRVLGKKRDFELRSLGATLEAVDAIEEINFRFREAGVGYRFEREEFIRVDSEFIHAEVTQPALHLLRDARFTGPEQEFRSAHAHYRAGEYKDCVTDANNAFESTLKTICEVKGWPYKKGARATDLLKVVRDNGLLPDYLDKSFDQLAATLASGLPVVRNEAGGHGQGARPRATPPYVAAYALHLAAAKIVLLVEALKDDS